MSQPTHEVDLISCLSSDVTGALAPRGRREGADSGEAEVGLLEVFSSDSVKCGVWECSPGAWNIEERPDTETMVLLSGRVRITTRGQEPVELGAGDVFVLPRGWSGRWEVLETVRKVYTIAP